MPSPDPTLLQAEDEGADFILTEGVWTDYQVANRYVHSEQNYMLPVASPSGFQGNSVAFVQLASPTTLLVVDWSAAKWAVVPTAPDPNTYQTGWVILHEFVNPAMKVLAADGVTPFYRLNGTYVYGKQNPNSNVFQDVTFPQPPWMLPVGVRNIPPNTLQKGIIDSPTNPGGGLGGPGFGPVPIP